MARKLLADHQLKKIQERRVRSLSDQGLWFVWTFLRLCWDQEERKMSSMGCEIGCEVWAGFRLDTGMNDWKWTDLFTHSEPSKPECDRGICFMSYRIIFLWDLVSCVEMQLRRGPHLRDSPDFLGTSVGEERKSHRRVSSPWPPDWQASVLSIELKPKAVKESLNHEHLVKSQP